MHSHLGSRRVLHWIRVISTHGRALEVTRRAKSLRSNVTLSPDSMSPLSFTRASSLVATLIVNAKLSRTVLLRKSFACHAPCYYLVT